MTVDDLLAEARSVLPLRPGPAGALAAQAKGALLIDIRGDDQRRAGGLIPGALVLPRNSLEWRCDPASPSRHPAINDRSRSLILICNEGFQSSLAAATLHRLGLVNATDLNGGFIAWATAGLPVVPAEQTSDRRNGHRLAGGLRRRHGPWRTPIGVTGDPGRARAGRDRPASASPGPGMAP